jgi:hypothetical protein
MKDFVIPWDGVDGNGIQDDRDMGTPAKSGAPKMGSRSRCRLARL